MWQKGASGARRYQNGIKRQQNGTKKVEPKEAKMEPQGNQKATKVHPKVALGAKVDFGSQKRGARGG